MLLPMLPENPSHLNPSHPPWIRPTSPQRHNATIFISSFAPLPQGVVQTQGRDVLDCRLLEAGATKTEHVVQLALNPMQAFMYQALVKVRDPSGFDVPGIGPGMGAPPLLPRTHIRTTSKLT